MKKGAILGLVIISILIISMSFASASWLGDVWGKITGKSIITGDATRTYCVWGGKAMAFGTKVIDPTTGACKVCSSATSTWTVTASSNCAGMSASSAPASTTAASSGLIANLFRAVATAANTAVRAAANNTITNTPTTIPATSINTASSGWFTNLFRAISTAANTAVRAAANNTATSSAGSSIVTDSGLVCGEVYRAVNPTEDSYECFPSCSNYQSPQCIADSVDKSQYQNKGWYAQCKAYDCNWCLSINKAENCNIINGKVSLLCGSGYSAVEGSRGSYICKKVNSVNRPISGSSCVDIGTKTGFSNAEIKCQTSNCASNFYTLGTTSDCPYCCAGPIETSYNCNLQKPQILFWEHTYSYGGGVNNGYQMSRCEDSDGGKNPCEKGTLTTAGSGTHYDLCLNNLILREYVCGTRSIVGITPGRLIYTPDTTYYVCPNKCVNGACI